MNLFRGQALHFVLHELLKRKNTTTHTIPITIYSHGIAWLKNTIDTAASAPRYIDMALILNCLGKNGITRKFKVEN